MRYCYVLHGQFDSNNNWEGCQTSGTVCTGTFDLTTKSQLPGGTITATHTGDTVKPPFVVTVTAGTGRYKNATGTISIARNFAPEMTFNLSVP
jgi:hypothetical protein